MLGEDEREAGTLVPSPGEPKGKKKNDRAKMMSQDLARQIRHLQIDVEGDAAQRTV